MRVFVIPVLFQCTTSSDAASKERLKLSESTEPQAKAVHETGAKPGRGGKTSGPAYVIEDGKAWDATEG